MKKARVLIVDDAALIRRLVSDALSGDPNIEVVGGAGNGRLALQMIPQTTPDLVTLDVEMPEMGGIETLRELRKLYPRLPVIMFSVLTERGCADTLEALSLGASDYVAKPATSGGREAAQQRIREDLIPRIKSLCRINAAAGARRADQIIPAAPVRIDCARSRWRRPTDRDGALDGRSERPHRSLVPFARVLSGADCDRAAHAADIYALSRGTPEPADSTRGRRGHRRTAGRARVPSMSPRATIICGSSGAARTS